MTFDRYDENGYIELSETEAEEKAATLVNYWNAFLNENDPGLVEEQDYHIHKKNLYEVIRRCDKREFYYWAYHKTDKICEYKRVALQAFWINTLKPFMVVNPKAKIYNCPNEMFSLFLILAVIQNNYAERFPTATFEQPSEERIRDIVYDFKYCSLPREAMIAFVETFADTYHVGIERIFEMKRNGQQSGSN